MGGKGGERMKEDAQVVNGAHSRSLLAVGSSLSLRSARSLR